MPRETDPAPYGVVVNSEEEYSIWRNGRPLPDGWRPAAFGGTEEECLRHIDEVWTALLSPEELSSHRKETLL